MMMRLTKAKTDEDQIKQTMCQTERMLTNNFEFANKI